MANLNYDDTDINAIISALKTNKRACIQLRRNFGKPTKELDLATRLAFYQVTNSTQYMRILNGINYFIVSLIAYQGANYGSVKIEDYFHEKYNEPNCSRSSQRQIEKIVSSSKIDDHILIWISKFVKTAVKNDSKTINAYSLNKDLLFWNKDYNSIPEKWARKIVAKEKEI